MKILYLNFNILDTRCDSRNNAKEQCSSISIAIPSKTEWLDGWLKRSGNNMKDIIGISIAYWRVQLR